MEERASWPPTSSQREDCSRALPCPPLQQWRRHLLQRPLLLLLLERRRARRPQSGSSNPSELLSPIPIASSLSWPLRPAKVLRSARPQNSPRPACSPARSPPPISRRHSTGLLNSTRRAERAKLGLANMRALLLHQRQQVLRQSSPS